MDAFSRIIGHQTIKDIFSRMIAYDRLPHAMLFVGPAHVGKTTVVTALIQTLFQTDRSIALLPDVVVLKRERDPKTDKCRSLISVKQVRQFIDHLSLTSLEPGGWKVGLVVEAHRLSAGAANALLKTLEEPKGRTLIILRAPTAESVLETIASRAQRIRFTCVSRSEMAHALQERGLTKREASAIAERSDGCPGTALRWINDSAFRGRKETAAETIRTLIHASLPEQFAAVTSLIPKESFEKGETLEHLLTDWIEVVREEWLKGKASEKILRAMAEVQDGLVYHINPHLALEHIFLSTHL